MGFRLGADAIAAGYRLTVHDAIDSTNNAARDAGRAGDPGPHWFVTTRQTGGRGRRGRAWIAPDGNLAASLLIPTALPPVRAATLGFVAGLALIEALDGFFPVGSERLKLKWPNDVLLDGGKLVGILLEAERIADGSLNVVIGIGVNVVAAPADLPYLATALVPAGARASAESVFERLSTSWAKLYQVWDEGRGLAPLLAAWRQRAAGVGQPIRVVLGDETIEGIFETIDTQGCLVLTNAAGARRTIAAGDVQLDAHMGA
jgi:BirA family biotin operon repressor/biotin-[acetyl-CoA-carboxylase] ligase